MLGFAGMDKAGHGLHLLLHANTLIGPAVPAVNQEALARYIVLVGAFLVRG